MAEFLTNTRPHHISFPAHGCSVITCLLFSHNRIISASDDHSIHIYNPHNGELLMDLKGHEGGIWALAEADKDTIVSGSTDRTVRIWNSKTGQCEHVFGGHTSTVRSLEVVKPEWVNVGEGRQEKWPKRPLIITGSRDHTLRVWTLPKPGDASFKELYSEMEGLDVSANPYHRKHLEGHDHAVRAVAACGRTAVSGSYDCTVRVWDIISGEFYSVVLDLPNSRAMSGAMDCTVRIWSISTGNCLHNLTGHSSLVGLLSLSPSYLVSGAADSTLRIWDPNTGALKHVLNSHTGAITCFWHDEWKLLSGSDWSLKMWDLRNLPASSTDSKGDTQTSTASSSLEVRDLLTGVTGVWQIVAEGCLCVAAVNRSDHTCIEVWDFGRESTSAAVEDIVSGKQNIPGIDEGNGLRTGPGQDEPDCEREEEEWDDPDGPEAKMLLMKGQAPSN